MLFTALRLSQYFLDVIVSVVDYALFFLLDVMFYIMFPLLLLGLDVLEPRVHRKQPLYLHEVVVRSAYTLPSPDPTSWDSTGYVVVVVE